MSGQSTEVAALRQQLSEREGENRVTTMSHAFERIGLDPNEGAGKAVAVTFAREPDQLEQFAEDEFGHMYEGAPHRMYAAIQDHTARQDQVGTTADPLLPGHMPMGSLMQNGTVTTLSL